MPTAAKWITAIAAATAFVCLAHAQDSPGRKEIKRTDLTGTKMEVILSTGEYKPGETITRHIHHGEEAFYVLEGGFGSYWHFVAVPKACLSAVFAI
jgi:quercetin dioxygenase-like cupin family protein